MGLDGAIRVVELDVLYRHVNTGGRTQLEISWQVDES
jgi:hypothetical protein